MQNAIRKAKKSFKRTESALDDLAKILSFSEHDVKVLAIEDDKLFKILLDRAFNKADICHQLVGSLAEALVCDYEPDIIFADINLPDSRKPEDLRILKNRFPDAVIIAMSACPPRVNEEDFIFKIIDKAPGVLEKVKCLSRGLVHG